MRATVHIHTRIWLNSDNRLLVAETLHPSNPASFETWPVYETRLLLVQNTWTPQLVSEAHLLLRPGVYLRIYGKAENFLAKSKIQVVKIMSYV